MKTCSALPRFYLSVVAAMLFSAPAVHSEINDAPDKAQVDFFEKNIRPVLSSKCYKCHSADSKDVKGGLLLDTREGILEGGDSGHAVVPGDVGQSLILKALKWQDKDMRMPPQKEGGKLPDNVIADFEQWIKMGAPNPRTDGAKVAKKGVDLEKGKDFWAFQSPKASPPPAVHDSGWSRSELDQFVLAALEAKGLHPVADADRSTLIRRVYFDLIGMPPSPEEIDAFLKDQSSDAFEKVVDRLLSSPRFGERWARHWLDVARYAESTGKERNVAYPTAWRYRDYVIDAFNSDKPYDQFIREQVAGDLLPASSTRERNEHLVATGFLAIGAKGLNEKNAEQFRMDEIDEQIDTTTRAVLGMTVACARCHDHKFDPIPQRDYYALAGIFRSTRTYFGTNDANAKRARHATPLLALVQDEESSVVSAEPSPAAPPPAAPVRPIPAKRLQKLAARNPQKAAELRQQLQRANAAAANRPTTAVAARGPSTDDRCMGVGEGQPSNCKLLVRGEITQPGENVPRGFVTVLNSESAPPIPGNQSGRLELAQWLTSPSNPLTARVEVNRIWLHLFGQGLVRTADNFGVSGEMPSNPQLLDALAVQFMRDGWSEKRFIRSIVLSRTYQLASASDKAAMEIDPDNHLLWRASPRRLDAEAIRDAILTASGQMQVDRPHGSVVANVGDGAIGKKGLKPDVFANVKANYRSVYLPIVRDFTPEVLEIFDFAEPSLVVAARDVTNVPSQALYLMNNSFVREQSKAMCKRILAMPVSYPERITLAYKLALGRPPSTDERARADRYLLNEARELIPLKNGRVNDAAELSWSTFCQALFACAEFRYLQ
ncbi:PSD1 and planctomycete cytochrome C domain-containing protein [Verrucomicrobiota bacterium sgz303538]